ncbi:cation diffusion facilitator family transporter [Dactylosporangium sucinum]|uniref:Cation efflux protein transmembrane domain-containing protein n=1 Tax=Dactylosporangium sucinum TaxID=1424081 RepID=A0A917UED3_9ACTN|nr:hypothetical protein GCM10007977_106520 [Dactylosporangium sucinum]
MLLSGSVALLGDTLNNVADALTAVPLWVAFVLGRRAANRRYTYGYGRAEDLARIVIVLTITASAVFAAYEAIDRLVHPADVTHLPWVAAAGVIGFAGNEIVARYRITVGRRIGSAAFVADGLHAQLAHAGDVAALGGQLFVSVKANQPTLFTQLKQLRWAAVEVGTRCRETGHGRKENPHREGPDRSHPGGWRSRTPSRPSGSPVPAWSRASSLARRRTWWCPCRPSMPNRRRRCSPAMIGSSKPT